MSVSCEHCGAVAGYGRELGHRSDCPTLDKPQLHFAKAADPTADEVERVANALIGMESRLTMTRLPDGTWHLKLDGQICMRDIFDAVRKQRAKLLARAALPSAKAADPTLTGELPFDVEARVFSDIGRRSGTLPVGVSIADLKLIRDHITRPALRVDNSAMMAQIEASQRRRMDIGDALDMNQAPHRCPVCDGRGQVQFNPAMPFTDGTSAGPWPCKPCNGTGIVWTVWQTAENSARTAAQQPATRE